MNHLYHNRNTCNHMWLMCLIIATAMMLPAIDCFQSFLPQPQKMLSMHSTSRSLRVRRSRPLYIFGRNKEDDDDEKGRDSSEKVGDEKTGFMVPFFGRVSLQNKQQSRDGGFQKELNSTAPTAIMEKPVEKKEEEDMNDPTTLFAKAERTRLEAERMEAELTLMKIDKLEQQLIKARSKGDSIEDLQRQLDALQAKLRGEPVPLFSSAVATKSKSDNAKSDVSSTSTVEVPTDSIITKDLNKDQDSTDVKLLRLWYGKDFDLRNEDDLNRIPDFLMKRLAISVGIEDYVDIDTLNKIEFLRRWNMTKNLDYSYMTNYTSPTFTPEQISRTIQQIQDKSTDLVISEIMIEKAGGNATKLALFALEYDHLQERIRSKLSAQDVTPDFLIDFVNQTGAELLFTSLYPKCTRKEGQEPTLAQVEALAKTVLPKAKFSSSEKPQKVPGGYIIAGTHKYENGDDLLTAIDNELAKTSLADKMTVLYTPGFPPALTTTLNETVESIALISLDIEIDEIEDLDPILYITGPDIVRESNRLGLTITSILGIATSWYLSIYPFLLNDGIGRRVDQELELLDASLQPDLTWLTDLSFPLFVTFIALQLVHELAHRLVAAAYDVELSVPTFVPSLITGITSSVTTFKTLPKNKEAMFDIAAAGPLVGIVASCLALALGAKLTLISDPSMLPALPLDILRQSTLGGAIIDNIIKGALYVPEGAPTAGIMISLHPVAIAGYISLVVNALSLLPIGTTDGGRLTMALFDRSEKMTIGSLTLLALLFFGLFGSDLFLFYFSFVIAFQTGNEVPARNEQDSVSFSRVLVATVAYAVALMSLVPFQ